MSDDNVDEGKEGGQKTIDNGMSEESENEVGGNIRRFSEIRIRNR